MKEHLEMLLKLQELDNQIIDVEMERDKIPDEIAILEEKLETQKKTIEEFEAQASSLEADKKDKLNSLELEKLKLKNTRHKEAAIQNIKQYEAYVKEIETQEKSSDELDEEVKEIDAKLEVLQNKQADVQSVIDDLLGKIKTKEDELKAIVGEFDSQLDDFYEKRDEIAEKIPEYIFLKYENISENKDGIAVAVVQNGHCMQCNMALPPQQFNELMTMRRLHSCPGCSRILVYQEPETPPEEEEEKPKAKKTKTTKKATTKKAKAPRKVKAKEE